MSKKVLESILASVTRVSTKEFNDTFKTLTTESSEGLANYSRDILNGSIHKVDYTAIFSFLKEYYTSNNMEVSLAEIKYLSLEYYRYLSNLSNNKNIIILEDIKTIVFLAKPSSDILIINIVRKLLNNKKLTTNEIKLITPYIPKTGFNLVKQHVKNVNELILKVQDSRLENLKTFINASIDIGHYGLSSNINFVLGIVVTTGIAFGTKVSEAKESLHNIYELLKNDADKAELTSLFKSSILSDGSTLNDEISEALFNYILDSQIELIRTVSKTGISGKLKITLGRKAEANVLKQINELVKLHVTRVAPQNSSINQRLGREIERHVRRRLPSFYDAAYTLLNKKIASAKELNQDIANLEGSPSLKTLAIKKLESVLKLDNAVEPTSITSTSTSSNKVKKPTRTLKRGNISTTINYSKDSPKQPKLRNTQGQFTSLTKLETLMRSLLLETVQKNMQRPNLRNQTGRFASSIKLDRLQRERDGAITAFLSYMKYPYATFEKGGKQGFRGYYPSRLLDQSAREIATKLVTARLKTVIV